MNPTYKILAKVSFAIVILFFAITPYNSFCVSSNKCQPIYFKAIFNGTEGADDIQIKMEVTNFTENLEAKPLQESFKTVVNRVNKVQFLLRNDSQETMNLSFLMSVKPETASEIIEKIQCLCSSKQSLKPKEEKLVTMIFKVNEKFYDQNEMPEEILINFRVVKN